RQIAALNAYLARKLAVGGVILGQLRVGFGIAQVVDGNDLDFVGAVGFVQCAQHVATDAAVAVDGDLDGHESASSGSGAGGWRADSSVNASRLPVCSARGRPRERTCDTPALPSLCLDVACRCVVSSSWLSSRCCCWPRLPWPGGRWGIGSWPSWPGAS